MYYGSVFYAEAYYSPTSNSIILPRSHYSGNDVMIEEFIHASKDRVYPNGIRNYSKTTGYPNIEFEAKLIRQIIYAINGRPNYNVINSYNSSLQDSDDFDKWLYELDIDKLDAKFPDMNKILTTYYNGKGYYDFISIFAKTESAYNYPTDYNLKPLLIEYINNNVKY